jgi:hypothetical protein
MYSGQNHAVGVQYTALYKVNFMVKTDESTTVIKPVVFKPPQIIFSHKRPTDGRGEGIHC